LWRKRKRGDVDSEEEWVVVDEGASREAEEVAGCGAGVSKRGGGRG